MIGMGKSEIVGLFSVLFTNTYPNLSQTDVELSQTLHSNMRIYLPVLIIFSSLAFACYVIGWDEVGMQQKNANDHKKGNFLVH